MLLERILQEGDVLFLMARLKRHAPHMYHHTLRVAGLFEMLWLDVEIDFAMREKAVRSVLLHDIGCLHYSKAELDELDPNHTIIGVEIVAEMIQQQRVDREMILYHHENLDGTGYPFGVDWHELSPFVLSLRIVDSFDIWSGGLYSDLAISVAMEELYQWCGLLYDEIWLDRFHTMILDAAKTRPRQLDAISRL